MADSAADKVAFDLVTPLNLVASEEVDMVVVPGGAGDFGVLPGHAPLISTVRPGVVEVHQGGAVTSRIFVEGGFAEANAERCTVLADAAQLVDEIDAGAASRRLDAAKEAVGSADDDGKAAAETELRIAEALVLAAGSGGDVH